MLKCIFLETVSVIVESALAVSICSVSGRSTETGGRLQRQARPALALTSGRGPHVVWGLACRTLSDLNRFRIEGPAPSRAGTKKDRATKELTIFVLIFTVSELTYVTLPRLDHHTLFEPHYLGFCICKQERILRNEITDLEPILQFSILLTYVSLNIISSLNCSPWDILQ